MVRGPRDGHRRLALRAGDTERCRALTIWLHTYNHHRGHTALGGQLAAGPREG